MRSGRDFGRRLRAALVLADQTAASLAAEVDEADDLNIGLRTIERIMQGQRAPRRWEVERFAEVLEVPVWFLTDGLDAPRRGELEAELEAQLQRFRGLVDELEAELGHSQQVRSRHEGR